MIRTNKPKTQRINPRSSRSTAQKMLASAAIPLFLVACSGGGSEYNQAAENSVSVQVARSTTSTTTESSFLALANEMAAQGDHQAAIPLYRRATKWHPFAAGPLVGLGNSLRAVGQYQAAEKVYQSALSRDEQNLEALKGLGKTYITLNRPTMAVPILHDAVSLDPRDVEAISSLALALELQGNNQAAIEVYKDGLSIEADNLKLLNNYGLSLALQSRHDQAIEILKQAAQHKDSDASHRQNLAMAYALAGNEMMSSRLLAIDNGPDLTNENLGYFRILANLSADDRFDAVVRQSTNPKTDTAKPANEVYEDNSRVKNITVARLVEVPPEPVVMVEPEPEPEPVSEPEDENVPPLLGPQGWALQIAAYRSKAELMPGWEKLKEKYADIIGDLEPRRSEIDLGEAKYPGGPHGFYYRLNAGPLTSMAEAVEACKKISALGTDCWVRVPEVQEGSVPEEDKAKAEEFRRKVYSEESEETPDEGA